MPFKIAFDRIARRKLPQLLRRRAHRRIFQRSCRGWFTLAGTLRRWFNRLGCIGLAKHCPDSLSTETVLYMGVLFSLPGHSLAADRTDKTIGRKSVFRGLHYLICQVGGGWRFYQVRGRWRFFQVWGWWRFHNSCQAEFPHFSAKEAFRLCCPAFLYHQFITGTLRWPNMNKFFFKHKKTS